ncbi:MAG: long-chain fatty acid--CoA ligase [Deltaproteobacteria bacterium]|nr:MAG: long-chain fatty acid--CoA ligase [Deltaproteobacteria bacterium]
MSDKLILRELSRYQLGTFADIIYRNAILYPDSEAFVCGSERISFKGFNERVNSLIHGLQALGIQKGDVIGILSWNRLEYPEVFGAAMKGGFVLAHFNPRLEAEELIRVIDNSEARVLFLGPEFVAIIDSVLKHLSKTKFTLAFGNAEGHMIAYWEVLESHSKEEPEPRVREEDPLVIFYTSGTTGTPRGAIYTHKRKMENTCIKALDIGVEFGDRHLVVLPMFHVGGDSHIWPFFLVGGCNVIMPRPSFDPAAALQTIAKEQITDVHIVPTQLVSLLNLPDIEGYNLHSLKRIWYAASPMPTEVLRQGLSVFGPVFIQGYGLTESGPHTTVLSKAAHRAFDGDPEEQKLLASCGQPCIGVHMRIVDEEDNDLPPGKIGEIIVRSERIMVEYWRRPDETNETIRDGWLYTGDMGYYDEKGFIYIADRKNDMIVTGGENVYPKEVEDVLYRHPAVAEAAVIGIPDPYWVEKVHALVVLKEKAQAEEEDIISFCRKHIAHYKSPKSVEFVESLPKNPQGKILKKEIRAKYWAHK